MRGFERFDVPPPGPSVDGVWDGEEKPSPEHLKPAPMAVCSCCRLEIADQFIMRVHPNMEFHASCLKCSECGRALDESCTAFVKDCRTYCKEDYQRLFATKCGRCARFFGRSEMVMRANNRVFHVHCFSCVACEKRLQPGDEFLNCQKCESFCNFPCGKRQVQTALKGDTLYCKTDCETGNVPEPSSLQTPSVFAEDDSWETGTMTSLDPTNSPPIRSPKSEDLPPSGFSYGTTASSNGTSSGGKKKKDKQTTRVRTVLNEHQLSILKKVYQSNPRPDAVLKEHLVEATGLNARVIRVWFQNKRCKDKKRQIQMRDYQHSIEKERALSHVRTQGVGPLVAAAPTTHVDNLGPPIDIQQHYQQWPPMDPYAGAMGYGGEMEMAYGMSAPFDYSPRLHASDLSSPSCSE